MALVRDPNEVVASPLAPFFSASYWASCGTLYGKSCPHGEMTDSTPSPVGVLQAPERVVQSRYLGKQPTLSKRSQSRKSDLYQTNPSISPHTAMTLHLVWDTVVMLRGSRSGGFEIGELTSISSPGRLAPGSEESAPVFVPPPPGNSPSSLSCFSFSNASPHCLDVDCLNPSPGKSLLFTQGLGVRLSILSDPRKSDRGRAPRCISYCCRLLCACISSRDGAFLAGTATVKIRPAKDTPAPLVNICATMRI